MTEIQDLKLDGNAIGGLLLELFGADLTAAGSVCGGCGSNEEVARLDVYLGAGVVVRCRHCENVMIRIVRRADDDRCVARRATARPRAREATVTVIRSGLGPRSWVGRPRGQSPHGLLVGAAESAPWRR